MTSKFSYPFIIIIMFFTFIERSSGEGDFTIDPEKSMSVPLFAGKVVRIMGEVFKTKNKEEKEVKVVLGDKFRSGDSVRTSNKSFLRVVMADDSVISLGPNSKFKFLKFNFKERSTVYLSINIRAT